MTADVGLERRRAEATQARAVFSTFIIRSWGFYGFRRPSLWRICHEGKHTESRQIPVRCWARKRRIFSGRIRSVVS